MTNKEAIKVIKHLYEANPIEEEEALDLAIKALEALEHCTYFGQGACGKCTRYEE